MWKSNDIIDDTYMIMNELGRGGTGVIYLAYHLRLEKYVVLKKIKDNFTNILKVRTEVDILKKLKHQYLPQVYDFMQYEDKIYTVIDYIDGCDLDQYIKSGYYFSEEQIISWLKQLCSVLEYLHSQKPQILHCDIKPGNIMITSEGNVCLIDFNISLDEESKDDLSGISQYYASPEQYEKAMAILNHTRSTVRIDQRTDIYSLGATFYHMISGVLPSMSAENYPLSQMGLGYSPELLRIIDRMMDRNKATRYKSVSDVLSAIDSAYKKDKATKKLLWGLSVSATAYVVLLVVGIWLCIYGNRMNLLDSFNGDVSSFEQVYASCDFEGAVSDGIDILNDIEYSGLLKNDPQMKADIIYAVGDSYFYLSNYSEAVRYYREAATLSKKKENKALYLRDLAIAYLRMGDKANAQQVINEAKAVQIRDNDLLLVEAEIKRFDKEHLEVIRLTETICSSDSKNDIVTRALVLAADAHKALGDYEQQIECLKELANRSDSLLNLRRLGDAYIGYAESLHVNNENEIRNCYEKARDCYQKVVQSKFSILNDSLNLSVIYMALEDYGFAISLLEELSATEKNEYRVFMNLAFAYNGNHNYGKAYENCATAIRLYEAAPSKEKEPSSSDSIQSLYALERSMRR